MQISFYYPFYSWQFFSCVQFSLKKLFVFFFLMDASISGSPNNLLVRFIFSDIVFIKYNVFKLHFSTGLNHLIDTLFISFRSCDRDGMIYLLVVFFKSFSVWQFEYGEKKSRSCVFINLLEFQKRWKMRWQAFYVYFMARSESIMRYKVQKNSFFFRLLFNF